MLMTLLAFWLRDWTKLQLAFALISTMLLTYYFLVARQTLVSWLSQQSGKEHLS